MMDLDKIMTLEECAAWLNMAPSTLAAKSKGTDAPIPGIWINARLVRFHPRTILARFAALGKPSTILPDRIRQQQKH